MLWPGVPISVLVVIVQVTGVPFGDWISQFVSAPKLESEDVPGQGFLNSLYTFDFILFLFPMSLTV